MSRGAANSLCRHDTRLFKDPDQRMGCLGTAPDLFHDDYGPHDDVCLGFGRENSSAMEGAGRVGGIADCEDIRTRRRGFGEHY